MRIYLLALFGVMLGLIPRTGNGQGLTVGERLRIGVASGGKLDTLIGTLARYDTLALWLQVDSTTDSVSTKSVRRLERSDGVYREPAAGGLFAAVWLAGEIGITYAASQSRGCNSTLEHIGCGALGFLVGGYAFDEFITHYWPSRVREEWVEIPLGTVSLRFSLSPPVILTLRVSFE